MCILCVITKWSRRVATMLPWLVIPLIVLWALSQLLPPAFRFEITSPRLACVFVLLVTLFWYEILMPQLSAWRVRRNVRLRERKRSEAIEMQKLRKTATRRCRNCLTPYRDQNPGGGRFMCSYCGHISKRPVLDLPLSPGLGLSNSGILKDLVGKGGKIFNGKAWSDNGWMCGQDWLENGNWVAGKPGYWQKNAEGLFGSDEHCFAEKSYFRFLSFVYKALSAFFMTIVWLWRRIFRVSSSVDDDSGDAMHRGVMSKRGENGENCLESKGEKARRKAEEKRQARLEKEQLEEEERKQREEVARLVEERRKLRDEKIEAERDRGKGSTSVREKDSKKEAEKKRQERKKEKDRGSSKSNSDVEEVERRAGKESERSRKSETDRREHHRTGPNSTDTGHGFKGAANNQNRGNAGTRYLDRMRGSFLSSSRAFTGGRFFGKDANTSATVSREHKSNDFVQVSANRRDLLQPERVSGKSNVIVEDKTINRPALIEPQPYAAPKKSWQQLFTRSSPVPSQNVISRPIGKSQVEVQSPPFSGCAPLTQSYENPINFGLPSPFTLSAFPYGSISSSTGVPLSSESMFPRIGEAPSEFLPEESDIFEDPCYIPYPVSLLGPVSESLDHFQLDHGFVTNMGLEKPRPLKNMSASSEVSRPSPIESPMSRIRVSDERHANSFLLSGTPKAQDMRNLPMDDSSNANEKGTWQMWNSSPLGQDGLGLIGGTPSWLLPSELNRLNKEDIDHPGPHKTMASLFKNDDHVPSATHSPQSVFLGNVQNGGTYSTSVPGAADDPWLQKKFFGSMPGGENHFSLKPQEGTPQNEMIYGSPSVSASNHPFDMLPANGWPKKEWNVQGSGEGNGNSSGIRPPVGGLYSNPNVQSLWSYD